MVKYIQDTKIWKEGERETGQRMFKEWNEAIDNTLIKCLGGRLPKVPKPPKGSGQAKS